MLVQIMGQQRRSSDRADGEVDDGGIGGLPGVHASRKLLAHQLQNDKTVTQ